MSSTRQPRPRESGSPYYLHTHRRLALRFYRLSFRKMMWTSWKAWIFRHTRSPSMEITNTNLIWHAAKTGKPVIIPTGIMTSEML
jgi:hypothetical protein